MSSDAGVRGDAQAGAIARHRGQGSAEPNPRRPAHDPWTTATGVPQAATHGGGPSAAGRGTACARSLSWSRPAAYPAAASALVTAPV